MTSINNCLQKIKNKNVINDSSSYAKYIYKTGYLLDQMKGNMQNLRHGS